MYLKLDNTVSLWYQVDAVANAKAVVVINHGFAEHTGRYDYVTHRLNNAGYSVYRYDLRGHGRTLGPKGDLDSYRDFINDADRIVGIARTENPDLPIFMLGHSMGGLVTAMYGITHPDTLRGQIFSGPAVNTLPKAEGINNYILKMAGTLFPKLKIANPVEDDVCSVSEVVEAYKNDPMVLKKATTRFLKEFLIEAPSFVRMNIHTYSYPMFLAHGEADKIVPVAVGDYLFQNIASEDKTQKIYPNLYHEILNENEKDTILDDMILWMDKHL
ncbi:alpha/beta hydrolase [Erysipelothrix anatis]|uniref:alpha/beta hydrolase n=1 Tax=Erysipelothrix anatis TaxID=2683713 RepID=UPI0013591F29|nr:alpha/beta hydrolase [Erysipelothrix anatis]